MKIFIPHLHYTVTVKDFKTAPEGMPNALSYVRSDGQHGCTLYLNKKVTAPDIAHELVHVLQFIFLNRNMNFTLEQEHGAYLMGYMMGKIMGYKYDV